MRLHISVYYPPAVTEVKRLVLYYHNDASSWKITYLEELKYIIPDIEITKPGVEGAEIGIIHVFKYQARCFALHYV
jgi:hypothetical protein